MPGRYGEKNSISRVATRKNHSSDVSFRNIYVTAWYGSDQNLGHATRYPRDTIEKTIQANGQRSETVLHAQATPRISGEERGRCSIRVRRGLPLFGRRPCARLSDRVAKPRHYQRELVSADQQQAGNGSDRCRAWIKDIQVKAGPRWAYPDLVVACNKPEFDASSILLNPILIGEVFRHGPKISTGAESSRAIVGLLRSANI